MSTLWRSLQACRRIGTALSCSRISQAMLSKKVMLAKAAEASRKTSPQEALSHSSGVPKTRGDFGVLFIPLHFPPFDQLWSGFVAPLTDERSDDVVHALQEAGQMLRGRVVRGRDLGHDGGRLGPGRFHAAVIGQDVGQAQDSVHLQTTESFSLSRQTFPSLHLIKFDSF